MAGSKTIFVANIPFDTSEEQLARVFAEAGPVQGVDIKFGPDGKPRGFGFIQFYDEAAAASAVRNLNGVEVNDRALRIEASSDTPNHKQAGRSGGGGGGGRGGGGGGRGGRERSSPPPPFRPPPPGAGYGAPPMGGPGPGPGPGQGYGPPPPMGGGPPPGAGRMDFGMLPPGIDLPRGEKALDQITKTLAEIPAGQLQDVMAGMKTLVATQPDQAHALLTQKPQLAYALFQAMVQLNIVDPQIMQQIQATQAPPSNYPPTPAAAPTPYPPPQQYNQAPPPAPYPAQGGGDPRLNSYRPPQPVPAPATGYGGPPPAQSYVPPPPAQVAPGLSPAVMAQLNVLPPDQRDILVQVLQMTPDQINGLDAEQRANIMQLRQQFGV